MDEDIDQPDTNPILESRNGWSGQSLSEYSMAQNMDLPDRESDIRIQEWSE